MPEKCHVIGCNNPVLAKGLCQMHYTRVRRTGEVEDSRPDDWGKREQHPLYKVWTGLRRHHRLSMDSEWGKDFWKFVEEVPAKTERSKAFRPDKSRPWSKDNFYWKESRASSEDYKEYMREWSKKSRAANPEYYSDKQLRKKYGVSYQWHQETFAKQNGVCAICKRPETTVIRGKVIAMPVDHDHNTGKARGLLCTQCNRGLGLFRDSEDILQAAIQYLKAPAGG